MRTRAALAAVFLVAAIGGCSTVPSTSKQVRVGALDAAFREVVPPRVEQPLVAGLPLVVGEIWGNTSTKPVARLPASFGGVIHLSTSELAQRIAPLATAPTPAMRQHGPSIDPPDTRLARVGTFFYDARTDEAVLGAGFYDAVTKDPMLLVFVDRPCRITGMSVSGIEQAAFDVAIPSAGLHWLRIRLPEPQRAVLTYDDGRGAILFATKSRD